MLAVTQVNLNIILTNNILEPRSRYHLISSKEKEGRGRTILRNQTTSPCPVASTPVSTAVSARLFVNCLCQYPYHIHGQSWLRCRRRCGRRCRSLHTIIVSQTRNDYLHREILATRISRKTTWNSIHPVALPATPARASLLTIEPPRLHRHNPHYASFRSRRHKQALKRAVRKRLKSFQHEALPLEHLLLRAVLRRRYGRGPAPVHRCALPSCKLSRCPRRQSRSVWSVLDRDDRGGYSLPHGKHKPLVGDDW